MYAPFIIVVAVALFCCASTEFFLNSNGIVEFKAPFYKSVINESYRIRVLSFHHPGWQAVEYRICLRWFAVELYVLEVRDIFYPRCPCLIPYKTLSRGMCIASSVLPIHPGSCISVLFLARSQVPQCARHFEVKRIQLLCTKCTVVVVKKKYRCTSWLMNVNSSRSLNVHPLPRYR